MTLEVVSRQHPPSGRLRVIGDDDDVIEKEKQLQLPLHKRLELVAGFNIHQLVKDARYQRHTLHTREGFYMTTSASQLASLFDRCSTRTTMRTVTSAKSSKSSKRSAATTSTKATTEKEKPPATPPKNCDLIRFDHVRGKKVILSSDRFTARRRQQSFCDGIVLSHRPIKVGERVHFKFNKVRRDWRGGLRVGFMTRSPTTLTSKALPSYAVPDLSRKSRFWAVPVPDKYVAKNNIFSILFQADGRVLYFVNNENKGTFLKGLNVRKPQWLVMDLYGRVIQITVVDDATAALGNVNFMDNTDANDVTDQGAASSPNDVTRYGFHATCGANIRMDARRLLAKRVDSFWNALTFTSEPLRPHDIVYIEIAKANTHYAGALGVGVTDVDPASINIHELPDNADLLTKNTSQYWVLCRDVETSQGDQLGFEMNEFGHITCSKNGEIPSPHMDADVTKGPLWLVFDVYGSTTTVRLLGIIRSFDPSIPPSEQDHGYTLNIDDVDNYEEDTECLMCFKKDRTRNCAIQPCGHITLCSWCAITCLVKQQLRFIVCPICGGPVHDVIKILSLSKRRASRANIPDIAVVEA